MIGLELDEAVERVAEPLDFQARRRGLDPKQVRQAIEIWEALRPEAVPDDMADDDEVFPIQLTEEAQVALHERSDRIGGSLEAFVGGWFSDKTATPVSMAALTALLDDLMGDTGDPSKTVTRIVDLVAKARPLTPEDLEEFAASYRVFACAKVGTEMGIAMLKGLRVGTRDVNRGVTRIDPVGFAVSLFEGSVIAEDRFTPAEERARRARWSLRCILATQHDRVLHADASLLDDYEMEYAEDLAKVLGNDGLPVEDDMTVLDYLMSKTQPNNRLFGTTSGREELWMGQVRQVVDFLRDFPGLDKSVLQEVEVRMVDSVRGTVLDLLDDATLGGTLHRIEGDKCSACEMAADEARDRIICDPDARDLLDKLLPLGALPDLYLAKAKMCMPGTGQQDEDSP